jgi:Fur family transcriptional regulator, ferric uptake regulator
VSPATIDRVVHELSADRLAGAGQRYTGLRRRLVEILARAGSPLSIPEIMRGRRGLPQSSVYRNLSDLEVAGVIRRVVTDDGFGRYELAEELTGHHHHLICSRCGRTTDVTLTQEVETTLDAALDEVARQAGFADVVHRLDLIGVCSDCAERDRASLSP